MPAVPSLSVIAFAAWCVLMLAPGGLARPAAAAAATPLPAHVFSPYFET